MATALALVDAPSELRRRSRRVVLLRHGESYWNRDGRLQGQALGAPGLTPLGWLQARRAAARLAGMVHPPVRLVCSDLLRAAETARVVARRLGRLPLPDERFREIDLGLLSGLRRDERMWFGPGTRPAGELADRLWAAPTEPAPAGESVSTLTARVAEALDEHLHADPDADLVVVAHGGVLRAVTALVDDYPRGMVPAKVASAALLCLESDRLTSVLARTGTR